jgi:DNA-binding CsgD family transcriptional regulator
VRKVDIDQLLDLVGTIYDAALSPNGWDPLLQRLTELFRGTGTVFFVRDGQRAGLDFARLWGIENTALEQFQSHFASVDVGLDALLRKPPGSVVTEESVPRDVYLGSEMLNDFRRPWDSERFIACDVFRDARRFGVLAVQGSKRRKSFGSTEKAVLERLLPHLRRAVQMQSHLHVVHTQRRAFEELIDGLFVGVLLLDGSGEVIHANAAARRIDALQDGLQISGRRLRATSTSNNRALASAIAAALDTTHRTGLPSNAALAVQRPSGARPFAVIVGPGPGADSSSPLRVASAVVLIGDPESRLDSGASIATGLYGLTPAEAHLACAVAGGESLESHAEARGIRISTVRSTMKQVLHKTGTRRQADLVRLLLTSPVALVKS